MSKMIIDNETPGDKRKGRMGRQAWKRWQDAKCKIHLDMHCPEWDAGILREFDARQIVTTIASAGAEGMVAFAKDCYGNAYYNTSVGHRHTCIGDRDLLAETIDVAHAQGMAVAAYFCAIWDNHAAAENPQWRMRGPNGEALYDAVTNGNKSRWAYVCHNSGFADLAEAMIEELARDYDADAFHLDMFNMEFGGLSCYCDACRRLFRERSGKDLPRTPSWDDAWLDFLAFRYDSVERYMKRLREAAHRYRPDAAVVMNYHASPGFDWRVGQLPIRHNAPSDISSGETYTPMLGDMYPGLETRFLASLVPGKPVELVSWRMNRITDYTTKPREQLRWELFSSLPFGTSVMLIDQPFHQGWLDETPYPEIGHVFREIHEKREYFGGDIQKHVGLYYSARSRDCYGRDAQDKFLLPVMGAYKALVESKIDVAFLFDETLSLPALSEYPVVFLPNVAAMNGTEVAVFTEYVKQGGTLIATYDTSLYDARGEKLSDFGLAEVFGVSYESTLNCDASYLRGLPEALGTDIDPEAYVLVPGPAHRVRPVTAQSMGHLHDSFYKQELPDQFFSHSMHPPFRRESDAVYINRYGRGKAVYLPASCDAAYAGAHELPEHRKLLRNAVAVAGYVPPIQVSGPLNVDAVVVHQGNRLVVHLVAFNPIRQSVTLPSLDKPIRPSIRMEEAPVYRAELSLNIPFRSVRAYNAHTKVVTTDRQVKLQCEDVHEVIVVELP